ncbi:hypothetical protein [Roseovarius sp. MMSF_3359]|uniref:hypothetical protein n=2 Tax=unclassified Roseovarius TaxID=2614913 RepID=UPI00273D8A01|nr:hypothetical protein [Roseovarius sp. MMSF_3359]
MLAAKEICEKGGLDFGHLFARQYSFSRQPLPRMNGWKYPKRLRGWGLAHCGKLHHTALQDKNGEAIGWLLGVAVDRQGEAIGKTHRFAISLKDKGFWGFVEQEITFFAGRYVAFLLTDKGDRVYFDPVMDLPAVFNAGEKTVASSPLMALMRPVRANHRLSRRHILKKGGNYGMQQTCDPDVVRGLSNHYLDLESFSLHRHWPVEANRFEAPDGDLNETAAMMVARLGQITGAILENHACLLPISGGLDSRTLAFSARDRLHHADGVYAHRTTWISQFDCYVGMQIAGELGLAKRFQVVDGLKAIQEDRYSAEKLRRLRWDFCHRTGYQHAPKPAELAVADLLPEAGYILRGNIMDMARANQWRRDMVFDVGHGVSKLVLGGRTDDENLAYWGPEYSNWMDTLPGPARARALDFAFVEQLLPNTLGGRLIGYGNACYLNPFNDRTLIQACMSVDPARRKSGELNKALHRACGASDTMMTRQAIADEATKADVERLFA